MKNERFDYSSLRDKSNYTTNNEMKYFFALISIIGIGISIFIYIRFSQYQNILIFSFVLIFGCFLSYFSFIISRQIVTQKTDQKINRTFELIELLMSPNITSSLTWLSQNKDLKNKLERNVDKIIIEDSDSIGRISEILNQFEYMATTIKHGYVDEIIMHEALSFITIDTFRRLNQYIKALRQYQNNRSLSLNLELLVDSWAERERYWSSGKKVLNKLP